MQNWVKLLYLRNKPTSRFLGSTKNPGPLTRYQFDSISARDNLLYRVIEISEPGNIVKWGYIGVTGVMI